MKTLFTSLALLTFLAFSFAPALVRAQDDTTPDDQGASFQTFYDQLGDQGTWVQTDDYGYVFQPNVSDPDWAPYTDGHWVYTDEGWTWVSDEPWGWATYHYGRWANIDGTGWVWVPGYRWAPAWVSWRYGGGYCGWAPLPPESFVGAEFGDDVNVGVGFHFGGDVDVNFHIGPGCYNFVRVGDLGEPSYRGRFINRRNNFTIINNTTNVTNINVNRNGGGAGANFRGVTANGPAINDVNAHSRQHIQTVQLAESNQPGRSSLQGNSLSVFAPRVNPATLHTARPTHVSQTLAHPTFNRGDSITKPLAVNANVKPAAPNAAEIQAAQTAQLHAPAKARVATEKTPMRTTFSKPLTSLAPVAPVHRTTTTTPGAVNGANPANPPAERSSANAPFTGESVKPKTEAKPATTFHPENQVQHQTQTEVKPAPVFHPENQVQPRAQTEAKPAATYHPENQVQHQAQTEAKPARTSQPENHVQPRAQTETKPAPAKPAPAKTEKKPADDKDKNKTP